MLCHKIFAQNQTGKLLVSPVKHEIIDRNVAFHLGKLSRELREGRLKEEDIFSGDETHFLFHLHTNRKLSQRGYTEVRYAKVVSCDEVITLLVTSAEVPKLQWVFRSWYSRTPIDYIKYEDFRTIYLVSHTVPAGMVGWIADSLKNGSILLSYFTASRNAHTYIIRGLLLYAQADTESETCT